MLKHIVGIRQAQEVNPAAFGRLCVETEMQKSMEKAFDQPPSGGCVLKPRNLARLCGVAAPAAFGRLCVETSV